MQHDLRDAVLARLIAADPQLSLEETLRVVVAQARATRGGLFRARGSLELLAGCGATQEMLDRVREAWERERGGLEAGRPLLAGSWGVWPVSSPAGPLLVYLAGEVTLQRESIGEAVGRATALLTTAVSPDPSGAVLEDAVDRFLEVTSRQAIERRQLVALLNRHEWNIARVARALRCNRVTVYKRLRRLGIPRLHVCRGDTAVSA